MRKSGRIWLTMLLAVAMVGGQLPSYITGTALTAAAATGDVVTWSSRTNLPAPRFGATAVASGNFVYVIGGAGFTSNGTSGAVTDSVNTVFGATITAAGSLASFTTLASMRASRLYPAAIAHAGYIYVFGGFGGGNSNTNWSGQSSIERAAINADGSLGSWATLATTLSAARGGMGVFSPGASGRVYLVGGQSSFGQAEDPAVATAESIDFSALDGATAGAWRTEASLPGARRNAATVAFGQGALVTGGFDANGQVTRTVLRADAQADGTITWSTDPIQLPVSQGIADHAAALNNGFLYVLGGTGNTTNTMNWIVVNTDGTLSGAWNTYPPAGTGGFSTNTDSPIVSVGHELYYFAHNFARTDSLEITLVSTTADMATTIAAAPSIVGPGASSVVTVTATNRGPDAATNALLRVGVPNGLTVTGFDLSQGTCGERLPTFGLDAVVVTTRVVTCALGTLSPGSIVTLRLHVSPPIAGVYTLLSGVSAEPGDPNADNDVASATLTAGVVDLSGIAKCGGIVLGGATVELLTGSTVVSKSLAGTDGTYTFVGVAPNASFGIRYTSADGLTQCDTTAQTTATGGQVTTAGQVPSLDNNIWPRAFLLDPTGDGVTNAKQDYIATPRDAWFKFPIVPSQQVIVSLRDCAFDCSLVLFTDIGQAAASQQSGSVAAVQQTQRAIAPAELSPAELSPAELSPAELSPAELSPAELSPAELSPAELSPAELSPAELSPAELSPAELSPAAYSSAQTASLLAISAHAGLSPELIVRNTWEHTGYFYVRVLSHDGATSSGPFTISARALPGACAGVDLTKSPSSLLAGIGTSSTQTLYLTNSARLVDAPATTTSPAATVASFMTRLRTFASVHGGTVIDFGADAGSRADYATWDAHKSCALAANTVADAINDVVRAYRANGGLKYIVITGGDNVIPFRRVPDLAGLGDESTYHVPVLDMSESQAALKSGFFLTQDFYAAPAPILKGNTRIYLPNEGIGRIVESPRDMTAMLDAFDLPGVNGTVAPKTALSTGYSFVTDLATDLKSTFTSEGFTTVDALIEAADLKPTDPSAWTADDLRAKLFGATAYDVYAINGHFAANLALAADYKTLLASDEVVNLPASDVRFRNALILSMGCHAGYSIVDQDGIPNLTQTVAWAEAWNGRGATVLGGTGYGYADTDFIQYSEKIESNTAKALGMGTSPVAIGDALVSAKSAYLSALAAPEGIDVKAAGEATLYGLPMMRYDVARPGSTSAGTAIEFGSGSSADLQYGEPVLSYALNPHTQTAVPVADSAATIDLTYYDASGDIQATPLQPILPRNATHLTPPAGTVLRGGALYGATYTEVPGINPRTDVATTETRGQMPTAFASIYTPLRLFTVNQIADPELVVLPLQYLTDGTTGTARIYPAADLHLRLYASGRTDDSALANAPSISNVVLTPTLTGVHVDVVVGGLITAGLEDVLFTYTTGADPTTHIGTWTSRSLRDLQLTVSDRVVSGSGFLEHVSGDIDSIAPNDVRLFVQAVSGIGLVSVASNTGAYYRVLQGATQTSPKHPTALTFVSGPSTSATYGSTISATVQLTDAGFAVDGAAVDFNFGGHHVRAITAAGGFASANFLANFDPTGSPYLFTAGFRENDTLLGSAAPAPTVTITPAASVATVAAVSSPAQYSDHAYVVGTLTDGSTGIGAELVYLSLMNGTQVVARRALPTDGTGSAKFDIAKFGEVPPGNYTAAITFPGSDFFASSTSTPPVSFTMTPEGATIDVVPPGAQPASAVVIKATVTQQSDGSPGDLTHAIAQFSFQPDTGGVLTRTAPVAADGSVTLATTLPSGVYTVTATVGGWFASGAAAVSTIMPVYDPSTFATGGGYAVTTATTSPVGRATLPAGKKANFGFNVKYKDGTTIPTGSLLFQLKEASIDFKATGFNWLVIGSGAALFEGSGTVNGVSGYSFQAIASQGSGSTADHFEIRIWTAGGSFDVPLYIVSNTVAGGSIKIH